MATITADFGKGWLKSSAETAVLHHSTCCSMTEVAQGALVFWHWHSQNKLIWPEHFSA